MSIPSQLPPAENPFEITVRTQSKCSLKLKCGTTDEKVVLFFSDFIEKNTKFQVTLPPNTCYLSATLNVPSVKSDPDMKFVVETLSELFVTGWVPPFDAKGIELKNNSVRETVPFHAFQTLTLSSK
jgi:hypothetical protein